MLTTDVATCLAIWENVLDISTGLGITSGVAPGATLWPSFAAFTPEFATVPITIPTESVNRTSVNDSSFWVRTLLKRLMGVFLLLYEFCARNLDPYPLSYCDGCSREFNGFISTNTTPPRMRTAPTAARP